MPKAFVACDFQFFPEAPLGGTAVCTNFDQDDMKILVKQFYPPFLTKEVRDARNAENYQRTVEWVRAQRMGG